MSGVGFILPAATLGLGSILIRPKRGFAIPAAGGGAGAPEMLIPQATIEERHHDEVEITQHPVEMGASITDHAYERPSTVAIRYGWSNSPTQNTGLLGIALAAGISASTGLAAAAALAPTLQGFQSLFTGNSETQVKQIYQKLLRMKAARIPFQIFTGKRAYKDMLIRSLSVETNLETENALIVTVVCQQVILVSVQVVSVTGAADTQENPEKTASVVDEGTKSLTNGVSSPSVSTVVGSATELKSSIASVQDMFAQLPGGLNSLTGAVNGVVNQLPSAMATATSAINSALADLPLPLEVPLTPNAQSFSISLDGATITDAVRQLPSVLTSVNSTITQAVNELPGVAAQLPTALSALQSNLVSVQAGIVNTMSDVASAISRARLGGL